MSASASKTSRRGTPWKVPSPETIWESPSGITNPSKANLSISLPSVPPLTKKAHFYRSIFESHCPGEQAAGCVPSGVGIACSTANVLAWDETFKDLADPSGRAVRGVHEASY